MVELLEKTCYAFYSYGKTKEVPKPTPRYGPNFGKYGGTLLCSAPRYEFYSHGKTKKVPKPNPRYDPNFGKQASALLYRAPRYDPRYGANPRNRLEIITWNIVFDKK